MNIRTSPPNALSVDELIIAQAFLDVVADRIHENGHEASGTFKTEHAAVARELTERLRGDKEKQLAMLRLRQESMRSIDEKRAAVASEIERLEVDLGHREAPKTKRSRA